MLFVFATKKNLKPKKFIGIEGKTNISKKPNSKTKVRIVKICFTILVFVLF